MVKTGGNLDFHDATVLKLKNEKKLVNNSKKD